MQPRIIFILLISLALVVSSCKTSNNKPVPVANNGVLDLTDWDFATDGNINLDGDWKFYWQQLIAPKQLNLIDTFSTLKNLLKVPELWNDIVINNDTLTGSGFGTYKLTIIHKSKKPNLLAIKLMRIETAYKLWINGTVYAENGKVATTTEDMTPQWLGQKVFFSPTTDTFEIILQVSNFNHRKGGISNSISIGQAKQISETDIRNVSLDTFLLGLLLIMATYHFGLFILRRKEVSTIYFGLTCLATAIHLVSNGEITLTRIFPNLNWEFLLKINFLSNYLRLLFITTFIKVLFKQEFSKHFYVFILMACSIMSVLILITTALVFTETLIMFYIIAIITLSYIIWVLFIATIRKKNGAIYSLIGIIIILATAINDILYDSMIINTMYLVPFGLFIFIFFQSYMLSFRFSKTFVSNEELTGKLDYTNKHLENIVQERTTEIEQQKEKMGAQRDTVIDLHKATEKQKDAIEEQNMSIKSSIQYASRIQQAILPPQEIIDKLFPENFILYKPRDIVSGDFYWLFTRKDIIMVASADCTGHGVPGAFLSMLGVTFLRDIAGKILRAQKRHDAMLNANEMLEQLRESIIKALRQTDDDTNSKDGMDIALCIINKKTRELQFSGANNPLIIIRNNELIITKPDKMPIGIYYGSYKPFTNHVFKLQKNDIIYMFSDGYVDQFGGPKKRKFLIKNFKELLLKIHSKPMNQQKEELEKTLENWMAFPNKFGLPHKQVDDILVMGFKLPYDAMINDE